MCKWIVLSSADSHLNRTLLKWPTPLSYIGLFTEPGCCIFSFIHATFPVDLHNGITYGCQEMADVPEKPTKAHCKSLLQSVNKSFSLSSHSVCSLHETVKLWCLYALQQYTPPSVSDFRGPLRVDGHTHGHTRARLHAIPPPPFPLSFPPLASSLPSFNVSGDVRVQQEWWTAD